MRNDGEQHPEVPEVRLGVDDRGGGQRPRVEEDRDERQAHRDLVADHLRGRAERAEDRVRRPRGPAGQHDAVDADRAHRQHEQHRHRQVRDLQRRLVVEDRHHRAPRDDREGDERRPGRDDRRDEEHQLVHLGGDDVLLERQLERVGDRLQQAPRPGPVGARPVLHPADHPALEPDHEDRGEQQEHEDDPDLEQHHPPDELVEVGSASGPAASAAAGPQLIRPSSGSPCSRAPAPRSAGRGPRSPRSCWRAATPRRRPSADLERDVTEPRSVATVTLSPSATPGLGRGGGGDPRHDRPRGAGQVRLAVLHPARVEELVPGGQPHVRSRPAALGG